MNQFDLVAMFTLGLVGNGHCIGMCGPLVVALPGQTGRFSSHFLYHAGRIVTYTAIGAFMGGMGSGVAYLGAKMNFSPVVLVKNIQFSLSLVAAAALMLFGLGLLGLSIKPGLFSLPEKIPGYKKYVQKVMMSPTGAGMFLTGLLLGFLPCGMSFAAFARALAAGGMIKGGLCVAAFGIGTLPGLLLVGTGGTTLFRRFRRQCDFIAGFVMILISAKIASKVLGTVSVNFF